MLKRTKLFSLLLLSLLAACSKQEPAAPSPQSAAPSATASEYAPPTAATDTPEPGAAKVAQANDMGKTVYDKHTVETFTELLRRLTTLIRRSVYKRMQGPPIVAVTERAFGFDLREAMCNKWNDI